MDVFAAEPGGPARKKPKKSKKPKANEESVNWMKRRARTIERRFRKEHDDIPADVQVELERELAALRNRVAEEEHRKRRRDMITKYHMVRFFGEQLFPIPFKEPVLRISFPGPQSAKRP